MRDERQKALQQELDQLNQAVVDAVTRRTAWMDEHMADFAKVKVGEEIFSFGNNYERLGVVTKLYRFWGDRDWRYDTSMAVNYQFETYPGGGLRNTSSESISVASKADKDRWEAAEYARLSRKFSGAL
jgi:hypothetical protein